MPPIHTDRRRASRPDPDDPRRAGRESEREEPAPREDELVELEYGEAIGETVDDAIRNALEILGADADEVEVQILEKGHRAFLGMGRSTPYRVRVSWRDDLDDEVLEEEVPAPKPPPAPPAHREPAQPIAPVAPRAAPVHRDAPVHREASAPAGSALDVAGEARQMLLRMGFDASIEVQSQAEEIWVRIRVPDEEDEFLLHGRRGETRAALQHLLQRIVSPRTESGPTVLVDINGRWERHLDDLRSEARDLARRALEESRPFHTRPLPSEERRIVHRALAEMNGIRTHSEGDGREKRVVISPAQGSEIQ